MIMIRAVSLFSGCGGSDLGLQSAGIDVIWANDIWEAATDVYKRNRPQAEVVTKSITEINHFPRAEILVGCYPCQGFSQGGKRFPEAPINYLFREFVRALNQVQPLAFLVENVGGMVYGANRVLFEEQLTLFDQAGYSVKFQLIDCRNYGLPQERKRAVIVGVSKNLGINFTFPLHTHGADGGTPWVSQRDALANFPLWPTSGYDDQPLSWYYMSRRRRRDWDECAPCVVASSRQIGLHPVSPTMVRVGPDRFEFLEDGPWRRYSFEECAALQGFATNFDWGERSVATKYRLIGNAVPPSLFERVGTSLVRALNA